MTHIATAANGHRFEYPVTDGGRLSQADAVHSSTCPCRTEYIEA